MKALKDCTLFVTPTSFGREDPALRIELENSVGTVLYNTTGKPIPSVELAKLLVGVDGYIAGLDEIDHAALANAVELKVIARYGVGIDNVDLKACQKKGIIVTNTPGANSDSVAELALGLILCLTRQIPAAIQATRSGGWPRYHGLSLAGKTVGLIGFGNIGQRLAQRLIPFGCSLIAADPYGDPEVARSLHTQLCVLEDVISQSDVISLHLPALSETTGMVNKAFFEKIKPGAFLVNTSRGELIVEQDLLDALNNQKLAGAALDAFIKQPPDIDNPLLTHPKVITTPHMGAHTDDATNQMGWMSLKDCLAVLQGQEPIYPVSLG